ncbi:RNA-binding motif protein, X-linked 2 isoform X1 [Ixodes scapularis]
MNPLTNVKNITKLNETELKLGINEKTSWHKKYKDSAWIFVGGLDYELTEGDIICVFSQFGEIVNINLIRDKKTGKSKGYCFLCFEDQRSTVLSVDNLNGISGHPSPRGGRDVFSRGLAVVAFAPERHGGPRRPRRRPGLESPRRGDGRAFPGGPLSGPPPAAGALAGPSARDVPPPPAGTDLGTGARREQCELSSSGRLLCQRTLRVDHVENYRPPKDSDDLDALMARLHRDGCAPEVRRAEESAGEEEEGRRSGPEQADDPEYARRLKKEKKKLKKERKKKKKLKKEKRKLKRMAKTTATTAPAVPSSESQSSAESGSATDGGTPARPQSPNGTPAAAPANGLARPPITGIQSRLVKLAMSGFPLSPPRPRSQSPKRRTPPAGYRSPSFQRRTPSPRAARQDSLSEPAPTFPDSPPTIFESAQTLDQSTATHPESSAAAYSESSAAPFPELSAEAVSEPAPTFPEPATTISEPAPAFSQSSAETFAEPYPQAVPQPDPPAIAQSHPPAIAQSDPPTKPSPKPPPKEPRSQALEEPAEEVEEPRGLAETLEESAEEEQKSAETLAVSAEEEPAEVDAEQESIAAQEVALFESAPQSSVSEQGPPSPLSSLLSSCFSIPIFVVFMCCTQ